MESWFHRCGVIPLGACHPSPRLGREFAGISRNVLVLLSVEADPIREEMDGPWYGMTEQEQNRIRGLAEDLTNLTEGGAKSIAMSPEERDRWAMEAKAALGDGFDLDAALAFLRRPFPQGVPPYAIPFLQSRSWERLGNPEVALRFLRQAEPLDPAHGN